MNELTRPVMGTIFLVSDVVITSVHSAKIRLKKMIVIIIIIRMNESQELMVFGSPRIDFRCETKARKVMVDFKFDAYSILTITVSQVGKKVNRKFVLVSETARATLHRLPHSLTMKNRKNVMFLSCCRKALPALSWTHKCE